MVRGGSVKTIGIDIDSKDPELVWGYFVKMQRIGRVVISQKSKHGYHFRIKLFEGVGWKISMELRMFCGDDPRRILFDILKKWHGFHMVDILFDQKILGWKK